MSTDPGNPANWAIGYYTGQQDTAYIPAGRPFYPVMPNTASIGGVTMDEGTTIDLGAFDLTVGNNVLAGLTGGISSTTGRLILTGASKTVKGNLPRTHVTGTYTLAGPVTARARVELAGGRLRTTGHRLQTTSF